MGIGLSHLSKHALSYRRCPNEITLQEVRDDGATILSQTSFSFSLKADVNFRIVDNGTNVLVYLNGATTPSLAGSSAFRKGNKISTYSRENTGARSELDFICVTPLIPQLEILPAVELRWVSISNQTYQVQTSTNLVDWTDFGDPISTPGGTTNQVFDSATVPKKFYRLGVE